VAFIQSRLRKSYVWWDDHRSGNAAGRIVDKLKQLGSILCYRQPRGDETPMKSVGEKLRRERIDHGIDLATLSSLTRISQRYLQAIETGNIDELPSGFFYRSFVRQYASALGLDTGEMEA